jgi:hypothetical protein
MRNLHVSRSPPLTPSQFVSLSPIVFSTQEALVKKLKSYVPKGKQPGIDDSSANKIYASADAGKDRGSFEHGRYTTPFAIAETRYSRSMQRLLYRILQEQSFSQKCDISDSWIASLRVVSIVFTSWSIAHAPRADRLRNPTVLDVGLVEVALPHVTAKPETTVHLTVSENAMLANKNKAVSALFGFCNATT